MTTEQIETIKRILDPAIRESVREVFFELNQPMNTRMEAIEKDVSGLKALRGKLLGAWTVIVLIVTLIGKAVYDLMITPLFSKNS